MLADASLQDDVSSSIFLSEASEARNVETGSLQDLVLEEADPTARDGYKAPACGPIQLRSVSDRDDDSKPLL